MSLSKTKALLLYCNPFDQWLLIIDQWLIYANYATPSSAMEIQVQFQIWAPGNCFFTCQWTCAQHAWVGVRGIGVMWYQLLWQLRESPQRCQSFLEDSFSCQPLEKTPGVALFHTPGSGKCWQIPVCVSYQARHPPGGSYFTTRWLVPANLSDFFSF